MSTQRVRAGAGRKRTLRVEHLESRLVLNGHGVMGGEAETRGPFGSHSFADGRLDLLLDSQCRAEYRAAESPGFGRQVAGTFFGTADADGVPAPILDVLTFNADGTFTGIGTDDFGFGDIATNGFNGSEQGAWMRTGHRTIATASLNFSYDANGALGSIFVVRSEATFSEDFDTLAGLFSVEIFLPAQNPLVDDPVASIPGTYNVEQFRAGDRTAGRHEADVPPGVGQQIAGTFFGVAEADGAPAPLLDVVTLNADGTYTGIGTDDFGFGDIATNGFNSPEHGVWVLTGPRTIATASLNFSYDANGALETIFVVRSEGMFSEGFDAFGGTFTVDIFLPTQDPLADDPVASVPGTYNVERLVAGEQTSGRQERRVPPGTGQQFAGTFFGVAEADGVPAPILDVLTFHSDGTFTGIGTDDFGFGDIATNGFNSPEHGVWTRTGRRSIATASLNFSYDANGALGAVFVVRSEATFSKDFDALTGDFTVQVFLPTQDPLSDAPVATIMGTYSVDRLNAIG